MTEISPSLLLSDEAQPVNGVDPTLARPWYGGNLSIIASGVPAGATFQIVMTIDMPPNGVIPENPDDWILDAEWLNLGAAVTVPGRLDLGHVNPCVLAVKVASSAGTTRVKLLIA